MIRFLDPPVTSEPARTSLAVGRDLEDALALFEPQQDCIGCSTAVAAPGWTSSAAIERVRSTFSPLADRGPTIFPSSAATGLLRRGAWTEVDIDARAQRLRTVRLPADLAGAQRLLAVNDLRGNVDRRPVIAIGLWALFAHPVVRLGARLGGTTDGLTAEIALAAHPDRFVLIESDPRNGFTFVLAAQDIVAAELIALAMRQNRARFRGAGPWEDPLVQAATDLNLGVRNAEEIDIDALISPTLSSQQRELAASTLLQAAELIGVGAAR
jgi:hypothetical protein